MSYSQQLLHYFHHTPHAGTLDRNQPNIYHAEVGCIENSDLLELYLYIDHEKILQARFKAHGSPALIATAEYLCEYLEGKSKIVAQQLQHQDLLNALELSTLHVHIAALTLSALSQCLK
jgi:NifU-like protein involved in Fe-S cluster formation